MASIFSLQVVTPTSVFYEDEIEMVIATTTEGQRGILKNHIPTVAGLVEGKLQIKKNGKFTYAEIGEGFMTVNKEKTVILTESANWVE